MLEESHLKTEEMLIGCMLSDYKNVFSLLPLFVTVDFFDEVENRKIFAYLSDKYYNANAPEVDYLELIKKTNVRPTRISELMTQVYDEAPYLNFEERIDLVIHESKRKEIQKKINTLKVSEEKDFEWQILDLKKQLEDMQGFNENQFLPPTDEQICKKIQENYGKDQSKLVFRTELKELDKCYQIRRQELTVIGASTSIGKSALGLNIAIKMAKNGFKVYYVSTEMGEEDQGLRSLANQASLNSYWIRDQILKDDEIERMKATRGQSTLYWDCYTRKIGEIEKKIIMIKPDVVIVDHLHDMFYDKKVKRDEGVSENIRALKNFAIKYNHAGIITVQLNREAEKAEVLSLAMIGQSSAIEQVADGVLFLKRDREKDDKTLQLIMMKNRHGGICEPISLAINLPTYDFY